MTENQHQKRDRETSCMTINVPLAFRRRGGRRQVVTPDGAPTWAPRPPRIDSTLVKALARAHRWERMLENGEYSSVAELAKAERINASYLARVLRLTLLAPDLLGGILDGSLADAVTLDRLMRQFPALWEQQRRELRLII